MTDHSINLENTICKQCKRDLPKGVSVITEDNETFCTISCLVEFEDGVIPAKEEPDYSTSNDVEA